ncbi:F-box protein-like protein [Tanacetum coccineum]
MSDNIPYEIQLEIIKKVCDVKPLIRFRSVSKQWMSFIDSPEFIVFYGIRDTQPHRLLLRYEDNVEVKYLSFVDNVTFSQQQQDFAPNVSGLVTQVYNLKVIGSSCGLWCFHGYKNLKTKMVVIWNPSIRKSVGIVMPPVLKIKWQVGIFTLSSKTWKMIPTSNVLRESVRLESTTRVAIDRFIFWVAYDWIDDESSFKNLILSFDLITHEFKEVNLPDNIANQYPLCFSICKLMESLVVSTYTNEVNGRVYGIWMMGEEGGAMTSFKKIFTINTPDSVVSKVLGYKKSGEPIIETEKDDKGFTKIKVYDPCSEHINDDFGITGVNGSFFICPYTETLLLTDHSDGCIIPNNY